MSEKISVGMFDTAVGTFGAVVTSAAWRCWRCRARATTRPRRT